MRINKERPTLLVAQRLFNFLDDLLVARLCLGFEASDHVSFTVEQKFFEIPTNLAGTFGLGL
jgi:hypothetical protein